MLSRKKASMMYKANDIEEYIIEYYVAEE